MTRANVLSSNPAGSVLKDNYSIHGCREAEHTKVYAKYWIKLSIIKTPFSNVRSKYE